MSDELAVKLHQTTDAQVWTDEFLKVFEVQDSDTAHTVFTWICNAIETGRNHGYQSGYDDGWVAGKAMEGPSPEEFESGFMAGYEAGVLDGKMDQEATDIGALGYTSAELANRAGAWDGRAPEWFPEPPAFLDIFREGQKLVVEHEAERQAMYEQWEKEANEQTFKFVFDDFNRDEPQESSPWIPTDEDLKWNGMTVKTDPDVPANMWLFSTELVAPSFPTDENDTAYIVQGSTGEDPVLLTEDKTERKRRLGLSW